MKESDILKIQLDELRKERSAKMVEMKGKITEQNFWEVWWKDYGSLFAVRENILKDGILKEQNREVEVGDGVTLCFFSDREAYTVIRKTKRMIVIQRDKATLNPDFKPEFEEGGFCGHCVNQEQQTYTYERNESGDIVKCYWSERLGCYTTGDDQTVRVINGRHEFYDYNF